MFIENLKSNPGIVSASISCKENAKFLIDSIVIFSDSNLQNICSLTNIKAKWTFNNENLKDFPFGGNLSSGLPNFPIDSLKIIFDITNKNIFSEDIDTELYVRFNYKMRQYGKNYSIVGKLVCEGSFVRFKWV